MTVTSENRSPNSPPPTPDGGPSAGTSPVRGRAAVALVLAVWFALVGVMLGALAVAGDGPDGSPARIVCGVAGGLVVLVTGLIGRVGRR